MNRRKGVIAALAGLCGVLARGQRPSLNDLTIYADGDGKRSPAFEIKVIDTIKGTSMRIAWSLDENGLEVEMDGRTATIPAKEIMDALGAVPIGEQRP